MERALAMNSEQWVMRRPGFVKGLIAGFVIAAIIFGFVVGVIYSRSRDREIVEYAERQMEIEVLREDYIVRDSVEFLELPGVRGAADGATAEFDRRVDEILQRFGFAGFKFTD
jgi:hypothetical protein